MDKLFFQLSRDGQEPTPCEVALKLRDEDAYDCHSLFFLMVLLLVLFIDAMEEPSI